MPYTTSSAPTRGSVHRNSYTRRVLAQGHQQRSTTKRPRSTTDQLAQRVVAQKTREHSETRSGREVQHQAGLTPADCPGGHIDRFGPQGHGKHGPLEPRQSVSDRVILMPPYQSKPDLPRMHRQQSKNWKACSRCASNETRRISPPLSRRTYAHHDEQKVGGAGCHPSQPDAGRNSQQYSAARTIHPRLLPCASLKCQRSRKEARASSVDN